METAGEGRGLWKEANRIAEWSLGLTKLVGGAKHTQGWGLRAAAGRLHLVHQAFWVEQRGPCDGVHLQGVARVGKQELRVERGNMSQRSGGNAAQAPPTLALFSFGTDLVDRMAEWQLT